MKLFTLLVSGWMLLVPASILAGAWPGPAEEPAYSLLDSISVADADIDLPADAQKMSTALWREFATAGSNLPWSRITVPVHADAWAPFRDRLLAKAEETFPDDGSLDKVLIRIENSEGWSEGNSPILPRAAFRTEYQGRRVWVIVCSYGIRLYTNTQNSPPAHLDHTVVYAIDPETMEMVGHATCR